MHKSNLDVSTKVPRELAHNNTSDDIDNVVSNSDRVTKKQANPKRTTSQAAPNASTLNVKVLTPKETRAQKAFHAVVKEADKQLTKLLGAVVTANEPEARRACEKAYKALKPILHSQRLTTASIFELCGKRLINRMPSIQDDTLVAMDSAMSDFAPAPSGKRPDPVLHQLKLSVKGELLRRAMENIDMGELSLPQLDNLHDLVGELQRMDPRDVPTASALLPGTPFTHVKLLDIKGTVAEAHHSLQEATLAVQKCNNTKISNPIATRPVSMQPQSPVPR